MQWLEADSNLVYNWQGGLQLISSSSTADAAAATAIIIVIITSLTIH